LGKKILRKCRESYTGYTQGGINTPRHILIKLPKLYNNYKERTDCGFTSPTEETKTTETKATTHF